MAEHAGKVYLVGSGPGDAAYLTLQAQAILAQAEVLIYDALVDGDLIDLVSDTCLKLDVGKRGGQPSTPQSEINHLLVEYCRQGKLVVRLKNGDPFIFGRAQSEIGALKRHDCDFEVVPGLSSALVAPLMAGIPLTDPQLSQSFTVVTGHNPDALNWVALSKMDTLVFLMSGRTLPEIVRRLRGHGRSPATPIAVIRYAGRAKQQIWDGTLLNILDRTVGEALSPCVVVVGEVVKLRLYVGEQGQSREWMGHSTAPALIHTPTTDATDTSISATDTPSADGLAPAIEPPAEAAPPAIAPALASPEVAPPTTETPEPEPLLPLANKTVLVTRAASQSSQFTRLLENQGAKVIEMPTLEIGPPSSWRDLDRAIAHIDDFDWLILTSTNGVDYFFQRLEAVTGEPILYSNIKIAVVGEKTAKRLAKLGIQPDFIPPNFVADALVEHFPEPPAGLRILFPRVESGGREVLVKELTNQGAKVREVAAYESRCPAAIAPSALRAIQAGRVDVITFASSKTVQHFCQLLQQVDADWQRWLDGVVIASIGPQTSQSCEQLLGRVDVEAQAYTLDGLTQAIAQWFSQPPVANAPVATASPDMALTKSSAAIATATPDQVAPAPTPEATDTGEPPDSTATDETAAPEQPSDQSLQAIAADGEPSAIAPTESAPTPSYAAPPAPTVAAEAPMSDNPVAAAEESIPAPKTDQPAATPSPLLESSVDSSVDPPNPAPPQMDMRPLEVTSTILEVELVPDSEDIPPMELVQVELDTTRATSLDTETDLIAELQAVIDQDEPNSPESRSP